MTSIAIGDPVAFVHRDGWRFGVVTRVEESRARSPVYSVAEADTSDPDPRQWWVRNWRVPQNQPIVKLSRVDACVCCGDLVHEMPVLCQRCHESFTEYEDGSWCDYHEPTDTVPRRLKTRGVR